jgi:Protein of unknown function (DUF2924)
VTAVRANGTILTRQPKGHLAADLLRPNATVPGDADQREAQCSPGGLAAGPSVKARDIKGQLADRLASLPSLTLAELRLEWRRLDRTEPPRPSRDILMRAVAYRLQERVHGGLSRVTQRRLTTLERELETAGRIAPPPCPRIKPGSRLIREWHGRTHTVSVTDAGFEFEGKTYRSLTKIALDITGAQWSGPRFFGLTKRPSAVIQSDAANVAKTISERANG